jgi:exodeoxyribonuclease-3
MLVGDFNVIPTDLDVYIPHAGATTRCSVQRFGTPFMLAGQGWTDAVRALYPDERIYTF